MCKLFAQLIWQDGLHMLSEKCLRRQVQIVPPCAVVSDGAVRIHQEKQVRQGLEDRIQHQSALLRLFLSLFAIGNVLCRTPGAPGLAIRVAFQSASAVDDPGLSIRPYDVKFQIAGCLSGDQPIDPVVQGGPIVRMDQIEEIRHGVFKRVRIHAIDPIGLIRPGPYAARQVDLPAADTRDPLRIGQHLALLLQLQIGFPALGDVACDADHAEQSAICGVDRRPGHFQQFLVTVAGKGHGLLGCPRATCCDGGKIVPAKPDGQLRADEVSVTPADD